jgi:prepilin-type N-terminal cleavage/methylation domain-containing protein
MRIYQRSRLSPRPAFTLVELVVVIGIVLVLAALTIMIFPRLQDSTRVAKGADVVQGQVFLAKQLALRDGLPRGVRLIQDPSDNLVHSLQIIEQPMPYLTGQVTGISAFPPPPGQTSWLVQFGQDPKTGVWPDFSNGVVQGGDYLDMHAGGDSYTTSLPHAMHVITGVINPTYIPGATPTYPTLSIAFDNSPNSTWNPTTGATAMTFPCLYQIVRQPRPMVGVNAVTLPTDVVVDCPLAPSHPALGTSLGLPSSGNQDILFDPSGKVLGSAGTNGKVVLWVYDWTTGNGVPAGTQPGAPEQTLVAVFTRTGNIVAQPVNVSGTDPYANVKDGATSGM